MKNVLITLLILSSFLCNSQSVFAVDKTDKDLISARTENSRTVLMSKNKYSVEYSLYPMFYKDNYNDDKELWKEIDLTPVRISDTEIVVKKAPYELNIDGFKVTVMDKKTGAITILRLTEIGGFKVNLNSSSLIFSKGKAVAADIAPEVDLEISWNSSKIKYTRILKSEKASTMARFDFVQLGKYSSVISWAEDKVGKNIGVRSEIKENVLEENIEMLSDVVYPIRADPVVSVSTGASTDDCYVYTNPTGIDLTQIYTIVGLGTPSLPSSYSSGFRFLNVTVPPNAIISAAYMTITAYSELSTTTMLTSISAEQSTTAATFSTYSDYVGRTHTTASIAWNFSDAWTAGSTYNTVDFSSVISELISDYQGLANANIVIFIANNGSGSNQTRYIDSYDNGSGFPLLYIEYYTTDYSSLGFLVLGSVAAGSTLSTGLTAFSIKNDGDVAIDVTVSGTDLTGGTTWTLSDTATAGANTYGLKAGISSYSIIVKKTAAYNTLVSNLAAGSSQSFGLQFLSPTSFSDGVVKTGTMNLIITAH